MQDYLDVFGVDLLESITAEREFVGENWISWLCENQFPFVIGVAVILDSDIKMGVKFFVKTGLEHPRKNKHF